MQKLDPRSKLLAVMLITVAIFFVDKLSICVILVFILIVFRLITGILIKVKHLISLLFLAAFIILVQTFFGSGLFFGLAITCRIFSLVLVFPILTETTPPHQLAAALHSMGFHYRIAFIITTAFNQIPHFGLEARLIMDAQKLRGISAFDKTAWKPSDLIKKTKAYAGICLPLVLGAMRKAQTSAVAMDSRAFGVFKTRTWIDKPKMKAKDYFFIIGCMIFAAILVVFNYASYAGY